MRRLGETGQRALVSEDFYMKVQQWVEKITELQVLMELQAEAVSKGARAVAMLAAHAEGGFDMTDEQREQVKQAAEGQQRTAVLLGEMLQRRTGGTDAEHAGLLAQQQATRFERFSQLRSEHVQTQVELEVAGALGEIPADHRQHLEQSMGRLRVQMDELLAIARKEMPVQLIALH